MTGSQGFSVSRIDNVYHIKFDSNVHPHLSQMFQLRANNNRYQLGGMAVLTDVNNRTGSDDHDAASLIPPFPSASSLPGSSGSSNRVTNLDRFLKSVTPVVPAHNPSKADLKLSKEAEIHPYFCIGDLWDSFEEWSAYGAGVPFLLNDVHLTTQYFVPFLSGMQLFIDPKKSNMTNGCLVEENDVKFHEPDQQANLVSDGLSASMDLNDQKLKQVSLGDDVTEVCGSRGTLVFEYMEQERPYARRPLTDKAAVLGFKFPELSNYRSCDLSPSSWICIAWYPIYRIPLGPTLEDMETSFLTLHSLSTQPGSYNAAESSNMNGHQVHGELGLSPTIRLPVIGLASYKLKGSIISPFDLKEYEQANALFMAATNWFQNSQASLPDFQFFRYHYSP